MDKKLKFVMVEENLTVGKVAAMLGVNSAVVSHILANRNKPSYQLTSKIVEAFPKYNPYWWLGISEEIYNTSHTTTSEQSEVERGENRGVENFSYAHHSSSNENLSRQNEERPAASTSSAIIKNFTNSSLQPIERVIVVYADKTFESFTAK